MRYAIGILTFVVMFLCSIGCAKSPQLQEQPTVEVSPTDKISKSRILIEPGFYSDGPEYDRVTEALDAANAKIGLDSSEWEPQTTRVLKSMLFAADR